MAIRSVRTLLTLATLFLLIPISLIAQFQRDVIPLKPWPTPLYWQPTEEESRIATPATFGNEVAADTRPANSLVFVGMTPCRVVDTRTGQGFIGAFGPPNLVGGAGRTFPIQSSASCSIPAIAQAYSFNITIASFTFVDFITVWPTGQTRPNASTLNGYVNTVIANAAIVPAGTSGSVDVFASQNTDLIIDINGYYAFQSGITLTQGNAAAPSLSFSGDPGTGIYSSGAGTLNIAAGGASRLSVASNGNVSLTGNFDAIGTRAGASMIKGSNASGTLLSSGIIGESTAASGSTMGVLGTNSSPSGVGVYGYGTANSGTNYGVYGQTDSPTGYAGYFSGRGYFSENVGIGTPSPTARLHVVAPSGNGSVVLPGSSISSQEMLDEPGVASAITVSSTALELANDFNIHLIKSRSITVPDDGYVLAIASMELLVDIATTGVGYFGISEDPGSFGSIDYTIGTDNHALPRFSTAATIHGIFPVTAGTRTYYLLGQYSGFMGAGYNLGVYNRQLTLIFLPTSYGTVDSSAALDPRDTIRGLPVVAPVNARLGASFQEQQQQIRQQQEENRKLGDRVAALEELLATKIRARTGNQ